MNLELTDNKSKTLKEDLVVEICNGSNVSIAAVCFSIYAFQELKAQLCDVKELHFTSPTFRLKRRKFLAPRNYLTSF